MFTKDDLNKYAALKLILGEGEFTFEGKAVMQAATLFAWFDSLGEKIEKTINPPPLAVIAEKPDKAVKKI